VDTLTVEDRSERMRRVKNKDSKPEVALRRLVFGMGYRYRLHGSKMPGHPDLVFRGRKKVIFLHGCFWHRHENCRLATTPKTRVEFWTQKFKMTCRRDREALQKLGEDGWGTLVVWQCELRDLATVAERVRRFLDDRSEDQRRTLLVRTVASRSELIARRGRRGSGTDRSRKNLPRKMVALSAATKNPQVQGAGRRY
jgi:DNA mismatch endonuclease (patch repair protein)